MITEKGIVAQATDEAAWVKTNRAAACEGCSGKDSCGVIHRGQEITVRVPNTLGVSSGDYVIIGIRTRPALLLTFLVYVVPILCLVLGALVGDALAPLINSNSSFSAMILGFLAFGAAFLILHKNAVRLNRKQGYSPVLIRKINPGSPAACQSASK